MVVRPDQTLSPLYGPTGFTFNPNVFEYDLDGRLLFSDDEGGKVWTMTNGVPTVLFNLAGAFQLTADRLNRLVVGINGQETLRLYSTQGTLLTNRFADVAVNSPLARGPGGEWGTGVYCVSPRGELWSLDTEGTVTQRGTSFGIPYDMVFGPDESLYVSEFNSDLIWRISFRPQLRFATSDDGLELSWLSQGDYRYQLESTTDLAGAVWTPEGEVLVGTGEELTLTVVPGTEPQKYYRLRMEAK